MNSRARPTLAARLPTLLLAAPVLVGLAGIVLPAFGYLPALGGMRPSLQPFRDLLAVPGLAASVRLSLVAGLVTTLVSVLAALLFVASVSGTRVLQFARRCLAPLLAVPHAAAAFGLAFLIAPSGFLARLVAGPLGLTRPPDLLIVGDAAGLSMMAGLVMKELPFLLLVIFAALPQADPERRLRLARALGHGRIAGFTLAVWPAVYAQIRLPVLAVAAYASSVVDVALILGPSTPPPLAVRLVGWMSDPDLALRFQASAGALLQCGVTLCVIGLWLLLERLGAWLRGRISDSGRRLARDRPLRRLSLLPVGLAGAAGLAGLAVLGLWSLAGAWFFPAVLPQAITGRTWTTAASSAAGPLAMTLLLGIGSAVLALVLVVALLESRRHRPAAERRPSAGVPALLYLPLLVPQVAFVFGLQILALLAGLAPEPMLVGAVHLVFVAPYVALVLSGPWAALDPRYERIARSLGHGRPATLRRVRLPLLLGPLLAALAIGFAVSAGQYLPTLLMGAGRVETITTEAVALAAGGDRRLTGAYALLQALLPALAFVLAALAPALLHRRRRGMRA